MAADHAGPDSSLALVSRLRIRVDARFRAAYSAVVSPVSHDTPPLRAQVHADRVFSRRSQSTTGRSPTQHAFRCSANASDIGLARALCAATRRLTDTRCLTASNPRRLAAHVTITSDDYLRDTSGQVIDRGHGRTEQSSCGSMSAARPHPRH